MPASPCRAGPSARLERRARINARPAAGGVGVALDADDGATVLHIAAPALRDYDISTAETISLLVLPAATLGGAVDLRANPSAVVRPAAAAVSGSLAANVGEAEVRASRQELRIDLTADRFAGGRRHRRGGGARADRRHLVDARRVPLRGRR